MNFTDVGDLVVQPYTPNWNSFQSFKQIVEEIEPILRQNGLCIIDPPPEWTPASIHLAGTHELIARSQSLRPLPNCDQLIEIEFGGNETIKIGEFLAHAGEKPIYASDQSISLFPEELGVWNLNKLNSNDSLIHDQKYFPKMEGITTSFTYVAMNDTVFGSHVEDSNMYSVNYIHKLTEIVGKPIEGSKKWIGVPGSYQHSLEQHIRADIGPQLCNFPLRHKNIIVSPAFLRKHGIPFCTIIQKPGQIVITGCGAYHCGRNDGYSFAEAVNFTTPEWPKFCRAFETCKCVMKINTTRLIQDLCLAGLRKWEVDLQEEMKIKDGLEPQILSPAAIVAAGSSNKTCEKCAKTFTRLTTLRRHIFQQHPDNGFGEGIQCRACSAIIRGEHNLIIHYKRQHANLKLPNLRKVDKKLVEVLPTKVIQKKDPKYKCAICGKLFTRIDNAKVHSGRQHPNEQLEILKFVG